MYQLLHGDSLDHLRTLPANSVDAVVTDPPYGLSKEPDIVEVLTKWMAGEDYTHRGGGFMGKSWDSFVPGPALWREVLRVLKPGGHILCFAGTRTVDLMGISLRLAGFEIRDYIEWVYATGFPKSHNVSKAIDKAFSATPEAAQWEGWGTALKPAHEPIIVARKPLDGTVAQNVLAWGTGAINIDGCRIGATGGGTHCSNRDSAGRCLGHNNAGRTTSGETFHGPDYSGGRWPVNFVLSHHPDCEETCVPGCPVAELDRQSGESKSGDSGGASRFFYVAKPSKKERNAGLDDFQELPTGTMRGNLDGSLEPEPAKARNTHPTVKPIQLMRYLVRLVTPPGGTVLDPFVGSGTTGIAATTEGFDFIGIDQDSDYLAIARARIEHWLAEGDTPDSATVGAESDHPTLFG